LKITILSSDKAGKPGLVAKHSFSLYIERNSESYLFGLGVEPSVLEVNARILETPLDIVDYAIVSHEHTPHYGGYRYLSQEAPYTIVYIPFGSMESLGYTLRSYGLRPVEVVKWTLINEGVYVSKPYYGPPYEHLIVFSEPRGLVVLTGCLHPGIDALLDISKAFNRRIHGLIGGFHLYNAPEDSIKVFASRIIDEVKPEFIVPLHCSGGRVIELLKSTGGVDVIEAGTGDALTI
jgi:7,8-dihydropterin-6-yl-methyl-4-(beta-D-ribofuranosyl)aminobenzene 5'-phosphate synthase